MGIFEELERIDGAVVDRVAPAELPRRRAAAWIWPAVTVVWVGQAAFWAAVEQPVVAGLAAAAAAASGAATGRLFERGQLAWGRRAASRRR